MSPTLIIAGIQASLRAAQTGADLYREHARDRKIFLPHISLPPDTKKDQLRSFIRERLDLLESHPELAKVWDAANNRLSFDRNEDLEAAIGVMLQQKARQSLVEEGRSGKESDQEARLLAGGRMVEQWREEKQAPSKMARFALTIVDVGLEFVGSNPSILGLGSRGERLVIAFAGKLVDLIPDDVEAFGPKVNFADRLVGIFLRAGLGALAENTSVVLHDNDVSTLVTGVIKPIVDALPASADEQFEFREIVDALAGPAAEATFKMLAENPEAYLGKRFADEKALGVVASALFEEVKSTAGAGGIVDVFSSQGVVRLYQAGLSVAASRPELFVGGESETKSELFRDLLSGAATVLQRHPNFQGPLGASLAASVIQSAGNNAAAFLKLDPSEPWENIAKHSLDQLVEGLGTALSAAPEARKGAFKAFSEAQVVDLGRILIDHIAMTPGMLGVHRTEFQTIIGGVAQIMGQDDNLLLNVEQWKAVAVSVAAQAAANPGRLFGMQDDDPMEGLAAKVLVTILKKANARWTGGGRDRDGGKPILFGPALLEVLLSAVKAMGGNVRGIQSNPDALERFLETLFAKAEAEPDRLGSLKFVELFDLFVGKVIGKGAQPTENQMTKALAA